MSKKFIIIIPVLTIIIFGSWLLFSRQTLPPNNSTPNNDLPFGSPNSSDQYNQPTSKPSQEGRLSPTGDSPDDTSVEVKALFKISNTPVAGFVVLNDAGTNIVRYADRATGNIYDAFLPQGDGAMAKKRITNKTLPQIYNAHFRDDGKAAIYQTMDDEGNVKNLSLSLTAPSKPTSSTSTEEVFYTANITNLIGSMESVLPGIGNTLYYFSNDRSAVMSSQFDGSRSSEVWKTPLNNWRLGLIGKSLIAFPKPSAYLPGGAYTLPNTNKLAGANNGLIALGSKSGKHLVYSTSSGDTALYVKDVAKNESVEVYPSTLADKCAWLNTDTNTFVCGAPTNSLGGGEPDSWYQGKTSFQDEIWLFSATEANAEIVLDPESEFGVTFDTYKPSVSKDDKFLVFINKSDLSLWALRLR